MHIYVCIHTDMYILYMCAFTYMHRYVHFWMYIVVFVIAGWCAGGREHRVDIHNEFNMKIEKYYDLKALLMNGYLLPAKALLPKESGNGIL